MDELTIIEVTGEGIVAVSRDGQRFLIPLNDRVRHQLAQRPVPRAGASVTSPKEIQSLLRSGLSVEDVAAKTGTDASHVARFEGPIVAELQFILERALSVPVRVGDTESSFGAEISQRIEHQGGSIARWQSYRRSDEWVVGARFVIDAVEEDATWVFDPRKMTLHPSNAAAVRMSSADSADAALFPPLRVVNREVPRRFDSGEFEPVPAPLVETASTPIEGRTVPSAPVENSPAESGDDRHGDDGSPPAPLDLLETLKRKRGIRNESLSAHPSTGSIPIITPDMLEIPDDAPDAPAEVPEVRIDETTEVPSVSTSAEPFVDPTPSRSRRQRAPMPTWDEIVFGTRPDDD